MAYYSSYSVDRIREKRRRRGRIAVTIMWALLLAIFVSGGSALAVSDDKEPKADKVDLCDAPGMQDTLPCPERQVEVCNPGGNGTQWVNESAAGNFAKPPCVVVPTCTANQTLVNNVCVTNTPTCGANQTLVNNVCVTNIPTCSPPQVLVGNVCQTIPIVPTCGANQTLVNNVCVTNTPTCDSGQHLEDNECVDDDVVCGEGTHRDPQTNTCVPNGQSGEDHGKKDCEDAGGTWDAQTDPKCTTLQQQCVNSGGTWNGQRCVSAAEAECAARGGSLDGYCYLHTTICHKGEDGTFSIVPVATTIDWDSHAAHGDKAPVDGSCAAPAAIDACPDALNPDVQPAGTTCIVASNTGNPAGAAAPLADPWVDPAVDVDRDPGLGAAAAGPMDGDEEFPEEVLGAGAAAPIADADDENVEVDEDNALPVTGMSPGGAILAALLALMFGAFAYGEAGRAARRAARAAA